MDELMQVNGMTASTPHILTSVSKSILGLLAGSLWVTRFPGGLH